MQIEIGYIEETESKEYESVIRNVLETCFEEENLSKKNIIINIILASLNYIKKINKEYRNIDSATDVLSFPMFEKEELVGTFFCANLDIPIILGDIVISIEQVKKQAIEYNHSLERELGYMTVHGFYHLMGYDHMTTKDKREMREKEENILSKTDLERKTF